MGMISNFHPWFCFLVDSLYVYLVYSCFLACLAFIPFLILTSRAVLDVTMHPSSAVSLFCFWMIHLPVCVIRQ